MLKLALKMTWKYDENIFAESQKYLPRYFVITEVKSSFIVEKSGRHHLKQVIKVNLIAPVM